MMSQCGSLASPISAHVWFGPSWAGATTCDLEIGSPVDITPSCIDPESLLDSVSFGHTPSWLDEDWPKLNDVPAKLLYLGACSMLHSIVRMISLSDAKSRIT